jgi:anti-anti-sigma factor
VDSVESLTIATSLGVDRVRLFLAGELDLATAPVLCTAVDDLLFRNGQHRALVVIDMEELTFCDSSGLHMLLELADRCYRVGAHLRITNVPANVHRVFEMTGTTKVLNLERR